jgi:hypothetical protein
LLPGGELLHRQRGIQRRPIRQIASLLVHASRFP